MMTNRADRLGNPPVKGAEMDDINWAALETDIDATGNFSPPIRQAKGSDAKTVRYPCSSCGGSGKYPGVRLHQARSDCFACGGRGYFLSSERDRLRARQQKAASKAAKLKAARAAFDEQYPDVTSTLVDAARWSPFAADLLSKLNQYGALTERQVGAVRGMATKIAERRAERAAERAARNTVVDLTPIRAMFETAARNGYKRPCYRAAGLVITRAPDHGRNPGALYIVDEGDNYLGKILGTQYTGKPAPGLSAIAADPRGEAIRHGQRTGTCSCCGRELTAEASIEAGIGPICASKWGL